MNRVPGHQSTLAGAEPGPAVGASDCLGDVSDRPTGPVLSTGRNLDVAIEGRGFLVILARDGGHAFSRAGNLALNSSRILTDGGGRPVLGRSGPICLPYFQDVRIEPDGTIRLRAGVRRTFSTVDRLLLARPDPARLCRCDGGLIRYRDRASAVADDGVRLRPRHLETSESDVRGALARMIQLRRQYCV